MASKAISILSLSQNRAVVRTIHDHIHPHGYIIGGILESDPFSTKDLALAPRAIEPRPRAVVVGRGYSNEETNKVRAVFAEYVLDVGADAGTVIKITSEVFDEVGKEGVPSWVLQQLETIFEKRQWVRLWNNKSREGKKNAGEGWQKLNQDRRES